MTKLQKKWQLFVTIAVIALVIFNVYLLFTGKAPFAQIEVWQLETLGASYVAILILTHIIVLAIELIPLFLLKWLIEKGTGKKLT